MMAEKPDGSLQTGGKLLAVDLGQGLALEM